MQETSRWGILGAAHIATKSVIPALLKSEGVSLDAIASRDLEKAKDVASRFGIARAYGSYEDLLADPGIDVIYNPLPNHLHVPMTIKALEAGKDVLCEKPIALTADEAALLAGAEARTGRFVGEAFMVRHHPQWQMARELVREGRIGTLRAIQTIFSYYLDDPANVRNQASIGGGGLYDVGCYAINTARFLFEAEPLRVIGLMDMDPALGTDRLTSGLVEFPAGGRLTFTVSTQLVPRQSVEILGTAGRITLDIPFNAPADRQACLTLDDGRDLSGGGCSEHRFDAVDQYQLQAEAFSRAIATRRAPPGTGVDDAILNMRVLDALFRSAKSGIWERP